MHRRRTPRRTLALVVATAMVLPTLPLGASLGHAPEAIAIPNDARAVTHALNRIAFGPRPGDVKRVQAIGLADYIDQQLHPSQIADQLVETRLATFKTQAMSARAIASDYYLPAQQERRERQRAAGQADATGEMLPPKTMAEAGIGAPSPDAERRPDAMSEAQRGVRLVQDELVQQRLVRAIDSDRQLQEVLVDFWFNHFNVFAGKGAVRIYLTEYERDVIRPHVLGSFRDLLGAVARSPAMLFYLDNWMSTGANAPDMRVAMRQPRGARRMRTGPMMGEARRRGAPVGAMPVRGLNARRDQRQLPDGPAPPRAPRGLNENYARELLELHTLGVDGGYTQSDIVEVARAFTGWTVAGPRQGGSFVFRAPLHDKKPKAVLGQTIDAGDSRDGERVLDILAAHPATARFIATKLARRFVADEPPASLVARAAAVFTETRGDLRAVTRAIVTSPEFFAATSWRAKVKSPFEFVVSATRGTGATSTNTMALGRALRELGQPLYQAQPPTGYTDSAKTWINSGALLARMNFSLALAGGRMRGIAVDLSSFGGSPDAARDALLLSLLGGEVSQATRQAVGQSSDPVRMAALTLGSPDFQRR